MSTLDSEIEDLRQRICALNVMLGNIPAMKQEPTENYQKYDSPKLDEKKKPKEAPKERALPDKDIFNNKTSSLLAILKDSPNYKSNISKNKEKDTPKSIGTEVGLDFSSVSPYTPFRKTSTREIKQTGPQNNANNDNMQMDSDSDDLVFILNSPTNTNNNQKNKPNSRFWFDSDSDEEVNIDKIRQKVQQRRNQFLKDYQKKQIDEQQPQNIEKNDGEYTFQILQPLKTGRDIDLEYHSLFSRSPAVSPRNVPTESDYGEEEDLDPVYYADPVQDLDIGLESSESEPRYKFKEENPDPRFFISEDDAESDDLPKCPTQQSDDDYVNAALNKIQSHVTHILEEEEEEEDPPTMENEDNFEEEIAEQEAPQLPVEGVKHEEEEENEEIKSLPIEQIHPEEEEVELEKDVVVKMKENSQPFNLSGELLM